MKFFARIKGIPAHLQSSLIDEALQKLDLTKFRKQYVMNLSGGNKRKVSVAIAILGNPPIILLDEPGSGMDPEARRLMWNVIANIATQKTSAVLLTTHRMDEAEFLSTKMGIMVRGGNFKCFGTPQFIKDKFGVGFEIEIKINIPNTEDLIKLAEEEFSYCYVPDKEISTK